MNNWTIGKRITFGFGSVLVIMLALGAFIWTRVGVIQGGTADVSGKSMPNIELLADAKEAAQRIQSGTYKIIFSTDSATMEKLAAKVKADTAQEAKDLEELGKTASPDVKALLDQVSATRKSFTEVHEKIMVAGQNATNAEQNQAVFDRSQKELEPLSEAYVATLDKCQQLVQKEGNSSAESVMSAVRSTSVGLAIGILVAVGLACVLGFIIIRSTKRILDRVSTALSEGAGQVSSAATQVTSSSQSLAEGASEQAASLEETSSSLEEMASMTKRNSENAQKANDLAKQARTAADNGASDMQAMSTAMDAIKIVQRRHRQDHQDD